MAQLRRLADMDVKVHTQIVVVPGLNDGPHLDRSIADLAGLYPALRSVSVVPVGLTRYHRGNCRVHTLDEVRAVFDQVAGRRGCESGWDAQSGLTFPTSGICGWAKMSLRWKCMMGLT